MLFSEQTQNQAGFVITIKYLWYACLFNKCKIKISNGLQIYNLCIVHGLNLSVVDIAIRGKELILYSSDPGSNPGLMPRTFTLNCDRYYYLLLEHVSSLVSRLRTS